MMIAHLMSMDNTILPIILEELLVIVMFLMVLSMQVSE